VTRAGVVALAALVPAGMLVGVLAQAPRQDTFADATAAWAEGRFADALDGYLRVLAAPDGDQWVDPIARQTGEVFAVTEITGDARNGRLSPRGDFVTYESGPADRPLTRVVRLGGSPTVTAEFAGTGAVFSRSGAMLAYVGASGYVLRDVATGTETLLRSAGLLTTGLAFGTGDDTVLVVGAREDQAARSDIYALTSTGAPRALTDGDGFKASPVLSGNGRTLLVALPTQHPIPRLRVRGTAAQGPVGPRFGLVDVPSARLEIVSGSEPVLSPDGVKVAWVARDGSAERLLVRPVSGGQPTVVASGGRMATPAFSPDSTHLTYARMDEADWEIFVADVNGGSDRRLTREIQHDVLPTFLDDTHVLAMIGEARHRRAQVYDVATGDRVRLLHNGTVRTIVPEYSWEASHDGTLVLIAADRDGDTISPERGLYLVDRTRHIGRADLVARLEANRASEIALREDAVASYGPIAGDIRAVVNQVSAARIYDYEKALFDFDSKHITQPGNRLASEYLFDRYRSFGYEPAYQRFSPPDALGGSTANVIARLEGTTNPELVYVVSSHYDSVAVGPGADDDTSGTAALLEAARVLAGHPLPATVVFASFTGEEASLLGSREFARVALADGWQVAGALNNDMIGYANDSRLDNTIRYSNPSIRDLQHGAAMLFTRLVTYDARYYRSTDANALFDAFGDVIGGIGSYPVLGNPHYHTASDVLETVNHDLIAETSKTTVASVMRLASSPSPVKGLTAVGDSAGGMRLTWRPSPEKGVRSYRVEWTEPGGAARSMVSARPDAVLPRLAPGTVVRVRAIDERGLEGWDWSAIALP
jgi:hypothetical protein